MKPKRKQRNCRVATWTQCNYPASDRLVYGRALEAVKEFDLPLDAVALEYSEARKLLDGVPLVDAARFYARHHGRGIKRKPVADAVDAMIAAKTAKGVSEVYLADLRYRLGAFSRAFHCDVSALTPDDVAAFFERLRLSPRSYNNFLRTLRTFFRSRKATAGCRKKSIYSRAWKSAARNGRRLKSSRLRN